MTTTRTPCTRASAGVKSCIDASSASGGAPAQFHLELRLRRADGSFVWMDTRFTFMGTRFFAVLRDVSAAKKAEVRP